MKALRIILIVLIIIIGAYSIWMATIDPEYRVERTVIVDAEPSQIYPEVSDFKKWGEWSTWHKMDPEMEITYGEKSAGAGASYSWDGEKAGAGTQTITAADPNKSMSTHIVFEGMGEADGQWVFEEIEPGKTEVTWAFMGESPFFFRVFNLGIDEAVGADFEEGLANLKEHVESMPEPQPEMTVEVVDMQAMPYYGIKKEMAISDMSSEFFSNSYGEMMAHLGEDAQNMLMPPMAFYYEWDEENDRTVVEAAVAVQSDKPDTDRIKKGMTWEGKALKAVHLGDYNTEDAHILLSEYMENNGYQWPEGAGAIEVYMTDPEEEPDTSKWITEVYYPVTLAENEKG